MSELAATPDLERIICQDVREGDRITRAQGSTPEKVEEIREGEKTRRLTLAGGRTIRPHRGAVLWRKRAAGEREGSDQASQDPSSPRHSDYEMPASDLLRLVAAELDDLPAVVLERYVAPKARAAIGEFQRTHRAAPVSTGRVRALQFWRRVDAYCEAAIRDRRRATSVKKHDRSRSTPYANSPEGMEEAHAAGEHEELPRGGCPACIAQGRR
jgi:hypothetical protein